MEMILANIVFFIFVISKQAYHEGTYLFFKW